MFAEMIALLQLNSISLFQFKNYPARRFEFSKRIVGLCGPNGAGKTNLLDAIYYLCLTRSYFGKVDAAHIHNGGQGFRIEGRFSHDGQDDQVVCILRENGKKEMLLNQESYTRFSGHIGKFPVVMVAPDDVWLITGASEERRKFIDTIISQLNPEYLQQLILYNKVLLQRNSALKKFADTGTTDRSLLEVLDAQLAGPGNFLFDRRRTFLESYIPEVMRKYLMIAGKEEDLHLQYQSPLRHHSMHDLLYMHRDRDLLVQRTTSGIHRDELDILLGDQPFKNMASQGQRKSLLFSLKLAEFSLIREIKGFPPLLLLDDVFEKLDQDRMHNLLHWACVQNPGQVFLTDTHGSRLEQALENLGTGYQVEAL